MNYDGRIVIVCFECKEEFSGDVVMGDDVPSWLKSGGGGGGGGDDAVVIISGDECNRFL